jgi:L-fuconolactonase
MIIDSQVHIWGPNTPEQPWVPGLEPQMPEPLTGDKLAAAMDAAGVDRAVLVTPGLVYDNNDVCIAAAKARPDRFAVMGRILVEHPDAPARLERMLAQKGVRGVRLAFMRDNGQKLLSEGRAEWFWKLAERRGIPVMMFAPGVFAEIAKVARAYPGLDLIIDHMNLSEAMTGSRQIAETVNALLDLAPLPNVSVKVSGLPCYSSQAYPFRDMQKHARRVIERFGPKRCFWGTDYSRLPCTYVQAITMFTEEMPFLSNDDLDWIMGRGLAEKIRWPIGG